MNSDRLWELLFLLGKLFLSVLGIYIAILWICIPYMVRSIVRQFELLNKTLSETNRLLAEIAHPDSRGHRESEATRNPFS